jgi:hypothetical protein
MHGTRPPLIIQELLNEWMKEHEVSEIPESSSSKKYSGTYICFYDERHTNDDGEKVIFARRYILDKIDQNDASLCGRFLATFDLEEEKPPGRDTGTVKLVFSPTPDHSNLAYVIEQDKLQDYPPVSGIVRAGPAGDDVYFFGILSKFKSGILGTIIAVRCLILKENKIFKAPLHVHELSKDMLSSETWCLLKYYFNGITPNEDDDCPSCLHAPNQVRVIRDDNSYFYKYIEKLVSQLYGSGQSSSLSNKSLAMAKDNISISSLLHDKWEEIRKKP